MFRKASLILAVALGALLVVGCSQISFYQWSPQKVITAFQANGLPAQEPRATTEADYAGAPALPKDGLYFSLPAVGAQEGGLILAYESKEGFEKASVYFAEQAKKSDPPRYVFARDNIIVVLSGKLSQPEANQYDSVLAKFRVTR
jgi:hypothetical protein